MNDNIKKNIDQTFSNYKNNDTRGEINLINKRRKAPSRLGRFLRKKRLQMMKDGCVNGEFNRENRMDLKTISEATGIPMSYLSGLELGYLHRAPEPERMKALAKFFNISIYKLLAEAEYLEDDSEVIKS